MLALQVLEQPLKVVKESGVYDVFRASLDLLVQTCQDSIAFCRLKSWQRFMCKIESLTADLILRVI